MYNTLEILIFVNEEVDFKDCNGWVTLINLEKYE